MAGMRHNPIIYKVGFIAVCLLFVCLFVNAQVNTSNSRQRRNLIRLVNRYYQEQRQLIPDSLTTHIYTKTTIQIPKRNYLLLTMPSMIKVARHGETEMFRETYGRYLYTHRKYELQQQHLLLTNVYKRRKPLDHASDFLYADIYRTTIVEDYILSPIRPGNQKFYIYHNQTQGKHLTRLSFKPKITNTQLVTGYLIVDNQTGRILEYHFKGMYDMQHFEVHVKHGTEGLSTIMPAQASVSTDIKYLGNHLDISMMSVFGLQTSLPDSLKDNNDKTLMEQVRPTPLTTVENRMVTTIVADKKASASPAEITETDTVNHLLVDSIDSLAPVAATSSHHRHQFRKFMWNVVGKTMLHRLRFNFGPENRGSARIGPLFNPFYFGYSKRKGFYYRSKVKMSYAFDDNHEIAMNARVGYSFKQSQVYTEIPVTYTFNRKHNGYVKLEIESGNHVTSSELLDQLKQEHDRDSINFDNYNFHYFRKAQAKLYGHFDFNSRIGWKAGVVVNRWSAIDKPGLRQMDKATLYRSFAPNVEVQLRPWGWRGPVLTGDYEHSFNGILGSNTSYDRWEFDASYVRRMSCMRRLNIRTGMGFYTHKGDNEYFLDYTNFRNNNIIGGWHDDWIGEFELLDANWYNASDYYVRCNTSYESPLMLLSFMPIVGQFVENERIYLSALAIRNYYPYVECGYAFTNHLFSIGLFTAFSHRKYEGVGLKFNIELFDDW